LVTLGGIEVRIHVTFLLLVALVALGSTAPGGPGLTSGMSWLFALFACVVLHELAHSYVARRNGIPVVSIDLLPIGGVSRMGRLPEDPGVELRMAAAGPAASIALGALFAAVAVLSGTAMWPPGLYDGGLVARLAWANLLLAAFNLLPAFPLDGGRVLRAVLEAHRDRAAATHLAARVGRIFAAAMIAGGLVVNLWLVVIGVFVYFGSWAEESATLVHELVKDLRVRDVMIEPGVVLTTSTPARAAGETLWRGAQREFAVVTPANAYVGLVSATALLDAERRATVGEVADQAAVQLSPGDPLEESGLLSGDVDVAAVVSEGRVVGLARSADATALAQRLLRASTATGRRAA
jgi:Zn-dependent protease